MEKNIKCENKECTSYGKPDECLKMRRDTTCPIVHVKLEKIEGDPVSFLLNRAKSEKLVGTPVKYQVGIYGKVTKVTIPKLAETDIEKLAKLFTELYNTVEATFKNQLLIFEWDKFYIQLSDSVDGTALYEKLDYLGYHERKIEQIQQLTIMGKKRYIEVIAPHMIRVHGYWVDLAHSSKKITNFNWNALDKDGENALVNQLLSWRKTLLEFKDRELGFANNAIKYKWAKEETHTQTQRQENQFMEKTAKSHKENAAEYQKQADEITAKLLTIGCKIE